MGASVAAVATVLVLGLCHLRNRRHPGWLASAEGRSYFLSGYSVVGSSLYWLWSPPVDAWEWTFAGLWAMGGVAAFLLGFGALNRAASCNSPTAKAAETVHIATERAA